jgi:hypothetical protein
MSVQVYRHPNDVPLSEAMLVWTRGENIGVLRHPDGRAHHFSSSVGACMAGWRAMEPSERLQKFLIELWHVAAFSGIPAEAAHQAVLCIPEYRDTLARHHLPDEYQHEREEG